MLLRNRQIHREFTVILSSENRFVAVIFVAIMATVAVTVEPQPNHVKVIKFLTTPKHVESEVVTITSITDSRNIDNAVWTLPVSEVASLYHLDLSSYHRLTASAAAVQTP